MDKVTLFNKKDSCNKPDLLESLFTEDQIAMLYLIRDRAQQESKCLSVCDIVSSDIADEYGFELAEGMYKAPAIDCFYHCWIMLEGRIVLDCTADQFGLDGIVLVEPHEPEYKFYKSKSMARLAV